MQALPKDLELYQHIKDEKRRTYAAMVHRLDVNIGRIMKTLEKHELTNNTLVFFLSDNGGPVLSNASCNAPYRGKKGTLLEGGIHVPFVMHWPGHIEKRKTYHKTVSSLDIAPTMFALAGGEINKDEFTGVNLMPYLSNKEIPHKDLKWKFTISRAIREGEWKLVSIPDRLPMLYHLPSDSSELKDMALDSLEITEKLLKKLGEWDVHLPHPTVLEESTWNTQRPAFIATPQRRKPFQMKVGKTPLYINP